MLVRRYRLFLTFLLVPAVLVILLIVVLMNVFGGGGDQPPEDGATALGAPTREVLTVAPATTGSAQFPTGAPTTPPPVTPTPTNTPTPRPTATPTPAPTKTPQEYEIQPGDSLSLVAEQFGLTTDELAEFNNIEDPNAIQAGQIILIPPPSSGASGVTRTPRPPATATPTPITATVDPDDGLNVRAEPASDAEVLKVLLKDEEIELTGKKQKVGDITWYELVEGGWVVGDYITIAGG